MKNTGISHYIFIKPETDLRGNTEEALKQIIEVQSSISSEVFRSMSREMYPIPFARVIPVPEEFFEFTKNSMMIETSLKDLLTLYHSYPELGCVILILTKDQFSQVLGKFEESLKNTQKKVIHVLNEVADNLNKVNTLKSLCGHLI